MEYFMTCPLPEYRAACGLYDRSYVSTFYLPSAHSPRGARSFERSLSRGGLSEKAAWKHRRFFPNLIFQNHFNRFSQARPEEWQSG